MSRPAVFLDRDGVLVEEVFYPQTGEWEAPMTAADVRLAPGAAAAARRLQQANFVLILVSNQAAHAKGKIDLRSLWRAHERFVFLLNAEGVRLDGEYYSFSHPDGVVAAFSGPSLDRKPSPYNLFVAAARHDIDLCRSWMIGDRDTDVACGKAAGTKTILIRSLPIGRQPALPETDADWCVSNLAEAAEIILTAADVCCEPMPTAVPAKRTIQEGH
jgi:D-glycero-D-manno-heptose 1,7-bisphosphate phosphatase